MTTNKNYIFGPVPSRRLGRSLGVDIVPFKVCSLNCVYCQLGSTPETTVERREYAPIEQVIRELKTVLAQKVEADYITLSGSGEPTLHSGLGRLIDDIKKITDIPVAILTNGTLLYQAEVRQACAKADLVVPSLDAADEQTFQKINRPGPSISFDKLIKGLIEFRKEYVGDLWLEVFLIEPVNTGTEQLARLKDIVGKIKPDRIQLNTAVRPTAEKGVEALSRSRLEQIAEWFGSNCEIIARVPRKHTHKEYSDLSEKIISMLRRRPCTMEDISAGLGISSTAASRELQQLLKQGRINRTQKQNTYYFETRR